MTQAGAGENPICPAHVRIVAERLEAYVEGYVIDRWRNPEAIKIAQSDWPRRVVYPTRVPGVAAGWVPMRCRECAAEVAVTARVCARCGAPIVAQRPVVADIVGGAVSDTAVSDAAGKAVPAGVAGQAPPEPYVPGSGAKLPAEFRLVLGGYAGIACGWFAGALACAAPAVFLLIFVDDVYLGDDWIGLLPWLVVMACLVCIGALKALEVLLVHGRFFRLLRRPSDPRTATVTASKRGGRTLILDIPRDGTGRGYQSLSEVRLALRTKAGTLVPGETVNVYGGSGGKRELLISSPRRARAFLGAVTSQSALQPRVLDEKVSGATLVDWAAWAASTTFSSTGSGSGYERREVDAFRSAVRDTFLGVSEPPVRSDDLRGKQFSSAHLLGYDKTEVAAFVEAAGLRLAAMESTDGPEAGALVSGAILAGWAEWVESTGFSRVTGPACKAKEVDTFQQAIRDTFLGVRKPPMRSDEVRGKHFSSTDADHGVYDKWQVAAFLEAAAIRLAAMESTDRPEAGALVSGAILAEWAEWADSTRFETSRRLWEGYATAEVDTFRKELRDTFLGVRPPPLTWDEAHDKQFTHTLLRPGYKVKQVDAFLDKAEQRLAAMRSDAVRRALKRYVARS
jgi:DivIVA domain-containing protein